MLNTGDIVELYGRNIKAKVIENVGAVNNISLYLVKDFGDNKYVIGYTCDEYYVLSENCDSYDDFRDDVDGSGVSYCDFVKKKIQYERSLYWIKGTMERVIKEYKNNIEWYDSQCNILSIDDFWNIYP